jgi:hypothetical protein
MRQTIPLLLALLCLLPASAFAQPFWPDPDDAYPYEPQEASDSWNEDWSALPPTKPSTLTLTVTPLPQASQPTRFPNVSDDGDALIFDPQIESRKMSGVNSARFDLVFQATPRTDRLPLTIKVQVQASDRRGRIVGERAITGNRATSMGRIGLYHAPIATLRCPETGGMASCADEASEMDQKIIRSASPGRTLSPRSRTSFTAPLPTTDWQYREDDDWEPTLDEYDE